MIFGEDYISKRLEELAAKLSPTVISILQETADKLLSAHPSILYVGFYTPSGIRLYSKSKRAEHLKIFDSPVISAILVTILGGITRISKELTEELRDVSIRYAGHTILIISIGNRAYLTLLVESNVNEGLILYIAHEAVIELEDRIL